MYTDSIMYCRLISIACCRIAVAHAIISLPLGMHRGSIDSGVARILTSCKRVFRNKIHTSI